MKTALLALISLFLTTTAGAKIVINEIMFAPVAPEPEWIEIFNNSCDAVNIVNAEFADLSSVKSIPAFTLAPYSYAVFTKDSSSLKAARQISPEAACIQFTIPLLNNDFDAVVIKISGIVEDSVHYKSSWGKSGLSIERKSPLGESNNAVDWAASIDNSGATCGAENSVAVKPYNLKIKNFSFNYSDKIIAAAVENLGSALSFEVNYNLMVDFNKNGMNDDGEIISTGAISTDSVALVNFLYDDIKNKAPISDYFDAYITFTSGAGSEISIVTDTLNLFVRSKRDIFSINELMFDPNEDGAEYIEIFYNGSDSVSRKGWTLFDESLLGKKGAVFTSGYFKPHSFTTVFFDSTFFDGFPDLDGNPDAVYIKSSLSLNNSGDRLFLADPNCDFADTCDYQSSWQDPDIENTTGRSLEKFNPAMISSNQNSWSTCADASGGTPCRENSLARSVSADIVVSADPNPFSPYSSGKDRSTLISGKSKFVKTRLNLKIYDLAGNLVRVIASNDFMGSEFAYVWDGRDEKGFFLPAGAYVALIESYDTASDEYSSSKLMIAIGN